jgi:UDPglucose 6-dehydrogenase
VALGRDYNVELPIVDAARHVNCRMREWAVERLQEQLKILKGRTIGILGVAFKAHTDDIRDSPGLDIARRLMGRGATVRAHDPVALTRARREASADRLVFCSEPESVFENADGILLATEWPAYRALSWHTLRSKMKTPIVIDGRNWLDPAVMSAAGYRYSGVGR